MTVGEKLRIARNKKGLSQEDVARAIHTTRQAIYKYENGIVTNIPMEKLQALALLLGVSPAYLTGWDNSEQYSALPSGARPIKNKRFPMLGEIACGKPLFADEMHTSYIDASESIQADFCLVAKGDSMIGARIHDGDVVFIRSQPIVENGEIAAVVIGDEATLKRWYFYPDRGKLVLNPENPAFEPLVYVGDELNSVRCLGKAVCFMSNL